MRKFIVIILMLVSGFAYSQNMVEDTYGGYSDSIAVAGSTDAGTTWFLNRGFDKVYVQIFNGSKWIEVEVASDGLKSFSKFQVEMEGSDTTLRVEGYTNDANATDIAINLPIWTTSSVKAYTMDFGGDGSTLGAVTSPFVVRFKGLYKRNF
jgi:hypothetical protein